jgi:hypothetical protein
MLTFSITGVDQTGVEAVFSNPLPTCPDLGSFVGKPVQFAKKIVGQITRLYRDATGPWVAKIALNDMNALRLSATGCLTAVTLSGGDVELRDRVEDHGQPFQYTKATGEKLCKRFTGLSEADRDISMYKAHQAKLPAVYHRPNANQFVPAFKDFSSPGDYAKSVSAGRFRNPVQRNTNQPAGQTWPNGSTSIGVAREIIPNRNASIRDRSNG